MIKTLQNTLKQDREGFVLPKSVQDAIPIRRLWPDGIFQFGSKFSKTIRFSDINYAIASKEDKTSMFLGYSELLNALDTGSTTKLTINNKRLNRQDFEQKILLPRQDDYLDGYRAEYNAMLMDKVTDSSNSVVQERYITLSVHRKSIEEARTFFDRVTADVTTRLSHLDARSEELDAVERLRVLHDFYRTGEETEYHLDLRDLMRKGHSFKDTICPDSLEFKKDHFVMGDKFGRVLFLKEYASYIKDSMISELTALNRTMMLSIDVIPVPTDEAVREMQNRLLGVETNVTNWQRRQNSNNNFSAVVPYDLEQQRKETREMLDDLTTRDQRMMFAVVTLVHLADSKDCLAALRELMGLGVTVYFEKENINTETLTTELMVSVSGALAQQESISTSQNQRISYKRRMERGEFITCKAPYGYRIKDGKNLEIHEKEAAIIRLIFTRYLSGESTTEIAAALTDMGLRTRDGKEQWNTFAVSYILRNEKYIGDALCQKTLATDSFPFIKKRNQGEKDQYYVDATHPAIISKEMFDRANALIQRRSSTRGMSKKKYLLTKTIYCGLCGSVFSRKETKSGYVTWACRTHNDQSRKCPMGRIPEGEIYAAFVRMYNKLKLHEGIILKPVLTQLHDLNEALQRDNPAMLEVNKAIATASEQSYKVSTLRSRGLLDEAACSAKLLDIEAKLTELRRERRRLLKNEGIEEVMDTLRQTADIIHSGPEQLDSFDEALFSDLVEKITAESQTRIRFRLYGGIELTEQRPEVGR